MRISPICNVAQTRESKASSKMVVLCRRADFTCGFWCTTSAGGYVHILALYVQTSGPAADADVQVHGGGGGGGVMCSKGRELEVYEAVNSCNNQPG